MWGIKDTSVTFCEESYKESKYIAEYYNTLTGVGYILVSLPFLRTKVKNLAIICIFLGIGTILLHMTQRIYGQVMDELSMLMLSYGILSKINKFYKPKYGIFLIGTYLKFYDNFIVFFIMFLIIILCIVKESKNLKSNENFKNASVIIMTIGMILWMLDQFACTYVKKYYLHSYWHICTCISIFLGFYCINDSMQDSKSKISHSGKSQ